jgi:hypothetical protein
VAGLALLAEQAGFAAAQGGPGVEWALLQAGWVRLAADSALPRADWGGLATARDESQAGWAEPVDG